MSCPFAVSSYACCSEWQPHNFGLVRPELAEGKGQRSDVNQAYIHGCEWKPENASGHTERHFRFPNTPDGWAQLLPQLDRTCWVALEVTGSAFEVHDVRSPHVDRVLLANPVDLKRLGSGRHTDRVDAARPAKVFAVGTLPTVRQSRLPAR